MPEENLWATFFTPEELLRRLQVPTAGDVVDFGCGYGTFTIPAARVTSGTVHALDIDPEMIATTRAKAQTGSWTTRAFTAAISLRKALLRVG